MVLTTEELIDYCKESMDDLNIINSWGETAIFYNPGQRLKRGIYIATIKESDGKNDSSSHLNREGVYRLNIGVNKETFTRRFGPLPKRASAGEVVDMGYDFSTLDKFLPHPVYAWMGWICILNPSADKMNEIKACLLDAFTYAKNKGKSK